MGNYIGKLTQYKKNNCIGSNTVYYIYYVPIVVGSSLNKFLKFFISCMHDYILKMFHIRKIKGECQIFEAESKLSLGQITELSSNNWVRLTRRTVLTQNIGPFFFSVQNVSVKYSHLNLNIWTCV